jgi:hypothetical protein
MLYGTERFYRIFLDCYKAVRQAGKFTEAREKEDPTAIRARGTS